jgi:hypothetical protein
MVGAAGRAETAQGRASELALIAPRGSLRWPMLIAAGLFSIALAVALLQSLAGQRFPVTPRSHRSASQAGLSSLPLAAQGPVSRALGADQPAYRVRASQGGFSAVSPGQHLGVSFDRSGVSVSSGATRVGLSLRAAGYGSALTTLGVTAPRMRANGVVYPHPDLSEWYANGPLGLEQGFTIPTAPPGHPAGTLTLAIALSGNAHAAVAPGGQSITLAHAGGPALSYTGLIATDARGRSLHAWLELRGRQLLVHVAARDARYPLRIDPLIQQEAKLTGAEEAGEAGFGYGVALSADGNTALIGGPDDDGGIGAAWVFTREGTTWSQQGAKLTGAEEAGAGHFGYSVALSADGGTALIGGPRDNGEVGTTYVGAAWVFTREGTTWSQQGAKLTGPEEAGAGHFGYSVALSAEGSTALIGGPYDNKAAGAAWTFTREGTVWTPQGPKLSGKEETGEGSFGESVALSAEGDTALIGGPHDSKGVGAVWVFTREGTTWTQQGPKLTGEEEAGKGWFGYSVALSAEGNTALIGGLFDNEDVGAAWVLTREGTTWTQQGPKLTGKEEAGGGWFGHSVALSAEGNTALIGGIFDNGGVGAAWVFTRESTTWRQQGPKLTGKEQLGEGHFGYSVALSAVGSTALIGGPGDDREVGAAWVFAGEPPTAITGQASSVTQSSVTLNATVNPNGREVSECYFEYGEGESYGSSMPCSSSPGAGESPVGVSSALPGLNQDTTYHFRIVATNMAGTSHGGDQSFTTLSSPPDFGRCVKVAAVKEGRKPVYHGGYTTNTCTKRSETASGKYEWHPGVLDAGFTTKLKGGVVAVETFAGERVTCKAESTVGEYAGPKQVGGVVIKFSGCELQGRQCTTPGLAEGELETQHLEGNIGWEVKAVGDVGLDLYPVGHAGPFMEYLCAGGAPVSVEGSLIAPVKAGKMLKSSTVTYKEKKGVQTPEHLESEPLDVLTASLGGEPFEPLGVGFTATQSNEEAVEINTAV